MLAYRLNVEGDEVFLMLPAGHGNQSATIQYQGDEDAIATLREWLRGTYGAFGHLLSDTVATPIDLQYALSRPTAIAKFAPKRIAGGELVESFDPGIPPGAMT